MLIARRVSLSLSRVTYRPPTTKEKTVYSDQPLRRRYTYIYTSESIRFILAVQCLMMCLDIPAIISGLGVSRLPADIFIFPLYSTRVSHQHHCIDISVMIPVTRSRDPTGAHYAENDKAIPSRRSRLAWGVGGSGPRICTSIFNTSYRTKCGSSASNDIIVDYG